MSEVLEQAEVLCNLLIAHATGSQEDDSEYRQLRQLFMSDNNYTQLLPKFVRTSRNLYQFWGFIKHEFSTYAERRKFIWGEFETMFEALENDAVSPVDGAVLEAFERFDASHVNAVWSKALDRRQADPDGAITIARTLLETVCKHILDEYEIGYGDSDLPKLYKLTAESLNIAPSQHTEQIFKQILGGCTSVVEGLGALRNRVSDSHGQGKHRIRPATRHAELAVNLSGAMATYLVATWEARAEVD